MLCPCCVRHVSCFCRFPLFQAASALHEMYRKFPVLYNSSVVSSFEPKVIYKVAKRLTELNLLTEEREKTFCLSADASDRPQRGHRSHPPALETEPLQRWHSPDPVDMGPDVDWGSGCPVGLGPPPPIVETLRSLCHLRAEGLHLIVGGIKSV